MSRAFVCARFVSFIRRFQCITETWSKGVGTGVSFMRRFHCSIETRSEGVNANMSFIRRFHYTIETRREGVNANVSFIGRSNFSFICWIYMQYMCMCLLCGHREVDAWCVGLVRYKEVSAIQNVR